MVFKLALALADPAIEVRIAAVNSLGTLKAKSALEVLQRLVAQLDEELNLKSDKGKSRLKGIAQLAIDKITGKR